jgi:hypothetical protein
MSAASRATTTARAFMDGRATCCIRPSIRGWASIDELIARSDAAGTPFSRENLRHVGETSDKKRFSLGGGWQCIRAARGHSVTVQQRRPLSQPRTGSRGAAEGRLATGRQCFHVACRRCLACQRATSDDLFAEPLRSIVQSAQVSENRSARSQRKIPFVTCIVEILDRVY